MRRRIRMQTYGDELTLDDTAFTTINEEVITNVSIHLDCFDTSSDYENEIEILSPEQPLTGSV